MAGPLVIKYSADASSVDKTLGDVDKAHAELATKLTTTGSQLKSSLAPASSAFGLLKGQLGGLASGFGPVGEGAEKASEGLDHLKEVWSETEGVAKKAGAVMVGAGAAVTGVGAVLTELGHGQETANLQLEQTFKNLGTNLDDYKGKLGQVVAANENHAISVTDTDESLAKLATALNDPKKAFADEASVVNLAKAQHESLSAATTQYIAILEGKGAKVLTQYGIAQVNSAQLEKGNETAVKALDAAQTAHTDALTKLTELEEIDHQKKTLSIQDHFALQAAQAKVTSTLLTQNEANNKVNLSEQALSKAEADGGSTIDQLNAKTAHMADTMDSSLGAKVDAVKVKLSDMAGRIGNEVGPAMVKAGPLAMGVGAVLESNLIPTLISTGAQFVGTGAMAVTTFGSMAAGAVADGATMAASSVATAATWVASNVAMAAASTAAFVAENAATLGIGVAIAALIAGIVYVATHWKQVWGDIKQWASDGYNFIKDHLTLITALFAPFLLPVELLAKNWGTIWGGIQAAVEAVWHVLQPIFGSIGDAISTITKGVSAVTSGVGSVLSHIPGLAEGGVVTSPTLAWVGESSSEAVIPLDQLDSLGGGGSTGTTTNVTLVMDNQVVGQITYDYLLQTGRHNVTTGIK